MIPDEYKDFGMIDIPRDCQCCFRVWSSLSNYQMIQTAGQPMHAYWSGNSIIVEMQNGTHRIYNGLGDSQYQTMYP
jgi:hypothetical protein